jgi:hypothetical protein
MFIKNSQHIDNVKSSVDRLKNVVFATQPHLITNSVSTTTHVDNAQSIHDVQNSGSILNTVEQIDHVLSSNNTGIQQDSNQDFGKIHDSDLFAYH